MGKGENDFDKRYIFWMKFGPIVLFGPIFLFIFGAAIFFTILNTKVIAMGNAGFIRTAGFRIIIGILAIATVIFCVRGLFKPGKKSIKGILGRISGIVICPLAAFFFARPVILDIPYLDHPKITYLDGLKFDNDYTGDGPARYYLRGRGIDGGTHNFSLGEGAYDEGTELWSENYELRAKVTYLPYTETVIALQYLPGLDEEAEYLFPPSANLPDDWESFSIQINDNVYSLPAPLSDFLKNGWMISDEDAGLQLPGRDDYKGYDSSWITLTNTKEQSIDVIVYNTQEQTIDITQGIVGRVSVIYGNYEFAGTELRIPGGLMLGWSTRDDVLQLYGMPDESYETRNLTYRKEDVTSPYWTLSFNEAGFLDKIMVKNQIDD